MAKRKGRCRALGERKGGREPRRSHCWFAKKGKHLDVAGIPYSGWTASGNMAASAMAGATVMSIAKAPEARLRPSGEEGLGLKKKLCLVTRKKESMPRDTFVWRTRP